MYKFLVFFFGLLFITIIFPTPMYAHAFGSFLYTVPIPLSLYLYGSVAVLIISFLMLGYFFDKSFQVVSYPSVSLYHAKTLRLLKNRWFLGCIKTISVFLFFFTILTGIIGTNLSVVNFNMTFFWTICMLGVTYACAVFGNIWSVLNPWSILYEWSKSFIETFTKKMKYPTDTLGYYPAFVFYFLFIYVELTRFTSPFTLSLLLILYSYITFGGILLIGKKDWFTYCDFFTVFFTLISYIAIFEYHGKKLYIRPPFIALLKQKVEHNSLLIFILFMLSSTAFDGVRETLFGQIILSPFTNSLSPIFGDTTFNITQIFGLFFSLCIFIGIYFFCMYATKIIIKTKLSISNLANEFAFSLIPIAFVYNIAHYYTSLLTQGQQIISLVSDPFGWNWNIFGTAHFIPNTTLASTRLIWNSQVFLILLGHVVAVYLSHYSSLILFPIYRKAVLSQIPLLLLMVTYTVIGLWILSLPLGIK